jgi:hypothetical protein
MRRVTASVILSAALVLAACSPGVDKTVAQSNDLVLISLTRMPGDVDVFSMAKQFPNTEYQMSQTSDAVTWTFIQNGADACRFTAKITPKDAKSSRVTTSMEDVSKGGERYLCNVAKIVGEESVSAALDGRSADKAKVQDQLKRYLISDFAGMSESVSKRMTEMAPPPGDPCPGLSGERLDACNTAAAIRRQAHEKNQAELDGR